MKNENGAKTHTSKTSSHSEDAVNQSHTRECPCCQFLKGWLARRKNRSEDDVAAGLLIYSLWVTRNSHRVDGLCGLSLHVGDLDFLGISVPEEVRSGLQVLAEAGLVATYLCRSEAIDEAPAQTGEAQQLETLVVDLLWLDGTQE